MGAVLAFLYDMHPVAFTTNPPYNSEHGYFRYKMWVSPYNWCILKIEKILTVSNIIENLVHQNFLEHDVSFSIIIL